MPAVKELHKYYVYDRCAWAQENLESNIYTTYKILKVHSFCLGSFAVVLLLFLDLIQLQSSMNRHFVWIRKQKLIFYNVFWHLPSHVHSSWDQCQPES